MRALLVFAFAILMGSIGIEESAAICGHRDKAKQTQIYISLVQGYYYCRTGDAIRNGFANHISKSCLMPSIIGNKFVPYAPNNDWGCVWATSNQRWADHLSVNNNSIAKVESLVWEQRESVYSISPLFEAGVRNAIGWFIPSVNAHTYPIRDDIFFGPYKYSGAFPRILYIEEDFQKYLVLLEDEVARWDNIDRYPRSFVLSHLIKLPIGYKTGYRRDQSSEQSERSSSRDYPNSYSLLSGALALLGIAVLVVGCYCRRDWMAVYLIFIGLVSLILGLAGCIGFEII